MMPPLVAQRKVVRLTAKKFSNGGWRDDKKVESTLPDGIEDLMSGVPKVADHGGDVDACAASVRKVAEKFRKAKRANSTRKEHDGYMKIISEYSFRTGYGELVEEERQPVGTTGKVFKRILRPCIDKATGKYVVMRAVRVREVRKRFERVTRVPE